MALANPLALPSALAGPGSIAATNPSPTIPGYHPAPAPTTVGGYNVTLANPNPIAQSTTIAPASTATAPTPAQTAAAAQAAAQAKLQAYLDSQSKSYLDSGFGSAAVTGNTYQSSADALLNQDRTTQSAINQSRLGVATGQINSVRNLIDQINQGLSSGRVALGNTNALDSSAAQAIGRIMQQYGITQRNSIDNDAAVKNQAQDVAQQNADATAAVGLTGLHSSRDSSIDQLKNQFAGNFQNLESTAALQGVTPNFNAADLVAQIVGNAQGRTATVDDGFNRGVAAIKGLSPQEVAEQAYNLSNAGVSGAPGYAIPALTAITDPTQIQPGASNSQLPLTNKAKIR